MQKTSVQRWAFWTLVFVSLLVFVGAIVRVTGAGLGCPDWPTCWGKVIPPWSLEQVDFDALDIERFQKKAERLGRDPEEITLEVLREEFNPVHTWTEFVNRLFALPVMISSLGLLVLCLRSKTISSRVRKAGIWSFVLVIANALLGAAVVYSRLKTGVITSHLALAFLLLFTLTYIVWAGGKERGKIAGASRFEVGILLGLVLVEGLLGSQIREMTDSLQREFGTESRGDWIRQIDDSLMFLVHRGFSWAIFAAAVWVCWKTRLQGLIPKLVLLIVFAFMLMGLVFSHVEINAVVQVLHVGLASILVSSTYYWWLASGKEGSGV